MIVPLLRLCYILPVGCKYQISKEQRASTI